MRKSLTLLLLSLLAASLVIFIPGCGQSSEDQAMRYIGRGDAYALRMSDAADSLSQALEDFFNILQGPNPEALAQPGGPVVQFNNALDDVLSNGSSAEAEYGNVLSLSGVEGEKEYAGMMIEVTQQTAELMTFIEEWFNKALDVIKTLDEAKIRSYLTGEEFEDGIAQIDSMRAEIDKLAGEARDYRLERDF